MNIFTSNLDSDIEAYLKTAYDLKRQFLKVPNRLSMRGQIFCQGSAIPFNLPPQKMVIRTPLKLVNKRSKSGVTVSMGVRVFQLSVQIQAFHLNYTVHAWIVEAIRVQVFRW